MTFTKEKGNVGNPAGLERARAVGAAMRPLIAGVSPYLDYLHTRTNDTRPGPTRTPERIDRRLTVVESLIETTTDPLHRVSLIQERLDLIAERDHSAVDVDELESRFIACAREFAERKGYTYEAFRALGVPPKVLTAAGIART